MSSYTILLTDALTSQAITRHVSPKKFSILRSKIPLFDELAKLDQVDISIFVPYISNIRSVNNVISYLLGKFTIDLLDWKTHMEFIISANFLSVPEHIMIPLRNYQQILPWKIKQNETNILVDLLLRLLSSGINQEDHIEIVQYVIEHFTDYSMLPVELLHLMLIQELQREIIVLHGPDYAPKCDGFDLMTDRRLCLDSSIRGTYVSYSPNGRFCLDRKHIPAFVYDMKIRVAIIRINRRLQEGAWSKDSKIVALGGRKLTIVNIPSRTYQAVSYPKKIHHKEIGIKVSDDGTFVLVHQFNYAKSFLLHVQTRRWAKINLIADDIYYAFSPDNTKIIGVYEDRVVIWFIDFIGDIIIQEKAFDSHPIDSAFGFTPDSKQVAWLDHENALYMFDSDTMKLQKKYSQHGPIMVTLGNLKKPFYKRFYRNMRCLQPMFTSDGRYVYFVSHYGYRQALLRRFDIIRGSDDFRKVIELDVHQAVYVKRPNDELIRKLKEHIALSST